MESTELDTALEELELRLERLRALYEQYFIGIEKLEPSIPRKDVDRRIYVLRREKIRNTGKRFKLQTLIQRYNTFQQYWMRICREIEHGTYKRHVLRAERTIGPTNLLTASARRRFGKERELFESAKPPAPDAERTASQRPGSVPPRRPTTVPPSSRSRTPTLVGLPTPPPPAALLPPAGRPLSRQPAPAQLDARHEATRQPAKPPPGERRRSLTPTLGSRPPPPPTPFESLELDMDFMGDWDPQASPTGRSAIGASPGPSARGSAGRPLKPAQPSPPKRPVSPPPPSDDAPTPRPARIQAPLAFAPDAAPPRPEAARGRLAPPPKPARVQAPAPVVVPELRRPAPAIPDAGPPEEQTVRIAASRAAAAAIPPRSARTPPAGTPSVRPEKPEPPRRPTPDQPIIPASPRVPAEARSIAERASVGKAPRPPIEPRPAAQTKANPPAAAAATGVTDARVRELHTRLQEANKQAGQKAVSLDGLAKSLRAAEAKLRAQHGNRRIEFEVVLKEGKPVVKPVVR